MMDDEGRMASLIPSLVLHLLADFVKITPKMAVTYT
jgi:hypothetical protein